MFIIMQVPLKHRHMNILEVPISVGLRVAKNGGRSFYCCFACWSTSRTAIQD